MIWYDEWIINERHIEYLGWLKLMKKRKSSQWRLWDCYMCLPVCLPPFAWFCFPDMFSVMNRHIFSWLFSLCFRYNYKLSSRSAHFTWRVSVSHSAFFFLRFILFFSSSLFLSPFPNTFLSFSMLLFPCSSYCNYTNSFYYTN